MSQQNESKQIIFSVTRNCPYECDICAMNAGPFYETSEKVVVSSAKNLLLYLEQYPKSEVDISGGDPLSPNAISTTLKCIEIFGQERCSVSTTGYYLDDNLLDRLSKVVGFDFTIDYSSSCSAGFDPRPFGYHQTVRAAIAKCVKIGIPVSVCTVLTDVTGSSKNIRGIQEYLDDAGVSTWIWLPLFAVGKARWCKVGAENVEVSLLLDSLDPKRIQPKLQHVLRKSQCHAKKDVLYVSPEGLLASCPWALCEDGRPHQDFVLGDLASNSCNEILSRYWNLTNCPACWKQERIAA